MGKKPAAAPLPETVVAEGTSDGIAASAPEVATEVVPPAPGEDPASVFERRMERLQRIVEGAEFESGTAKGDLTGLLVDLFKHRPQLWSAMSSSDQRDTVKQIDQMVGLALRKVVAVIAQAESHYIEATFLGQFSVKGETIEAKLKVEHADSGVLNDVFNLAGHKVIMISADDKRFSGKRGDVDIMPDQLGMAFADEKPKAPTVIETPTPDAPDGDTDLSGEDDDEDGQAPYVVFDPAEGVFLKSDGNWSDLIEDAQQFDDKAQAEEKATAEEAEIRSLAEISSSTAAPQS